MCSTTIQNEPTSSKSSNDDVQLSASSFTPEKTKDYNNKNINDVMNNFATSKIPFLLESSKNFDINYDSQSDISLDEQATASKNVKDIDENNIESKPGDYFEFSTTTTTELSGEGQGALQVHLNLSEPQQPVGLLQQKRHGRQEIPRIYNNREIESSMQTVPSNRQANPDIQDIITGIVKLLNGNVNVAVNTVRPLKPIQATRINNRGPPRLSDLPQLPQDFNTPGMNPPPPPLAPEHPYPFEKPPPERPLINQLPPAPERPSMRPYVNGIPIQETTVSTNTNRPWTRPYHTTNRRPRPPFKPLPNHNTNITIEKNEFTTSLSTDLSTNSDLSTEILNETIMEVTKKPPKYQSPLKQDKINKDNTLILGGGEIQPIPIPIGTIKPHENINDINHKIQESKLNTKELSSTATTTTTSTTTSKIETTSSILNIQSTRSTIEIQPSIVYLESTTDNNKNSLISSSITPLTIIETTKLLEPSKIIEETNDKINIFSSIPTEELPIKYQTSSSTTTSTTTAAATTTTILNKVERPIQRPTSMTTYQKPTLQNSYSQYRPRPGIVLDDTLDYTKSQSHATQRPFNPPRHPQIGDIFDVTVSAIQGPGGGGGNQKDSVRVSVNQGTADVIVTSAVEGQKYVSIDGKRTYLNLFDGNNNNDETSLPTQIQIQPSHTQEPAIIGTGHVVPQLDVQSSSSSSSQRPNLPAKRPTFHRRPTQPPVRIDTCIVGDTSTCDISQHEACATVQGVSACHCKPGFARIIHTLPCKRVVSIVVSIRIDRIYDRDVVWNNELDDKDSESYQVIAFESNKAIESAMSMTPFSDEYMGSFINSIYHGDVSQGQGGVFVNATLKLTYESRTARPSLAGELQKQLLGVIHRRYNNFGESAVYVNSPAGSISNLQDLDECASSELNDCHSSAICTNTWGGFNCVCKSGLKDPHKDDNDKSGRNCLSCPSSYCSNRGICSYQGNEMQCTCTGNYYGEKCGVDGEVLAVSIGACVSALIIIALTVICLVMWSRRWSREQKALGSPVYGYMQGGIPGTLPNTLARVGSMGTLASIKQGPPGNLPPYMWGHIADHMATANLYAAEPMGPTRPSSAVFGYPTMSMHGTLPPVPLPRLQAPPRPRQRHQPEPDSSDSEPMDKDRADLIPQNNGFHVPRPKSRSSLANQSEIYYDVQYDQGDAHHLSKNNIPMSTYSMARPYYRT
ncbi:hypothetical protein HCN44_005707 [Aphidius gifuensis]|uniref:63 kDa sperm flagellar membrane protein n=1 Tax=Aphidius gifuensis TaxID=684658 RepID=A0A834XY21_APHGI|nr:hypothetical protein HCN44_005707 [Aphidius gifuensis]